MTAPPDPRAGTPEPPIALTDPSHAPMVEMIRTVWPGGQHAAPHYADGPHHLVCVRAAEAPEYAADVVLRAYAAHGVELPCLENDTADHLGFDIVVMYPLPDLPAQLLGWHSRERQLYVDDEFGIGGLPEPAGPADWARAITGLLTWNAEPDPRLTPVLEAAILDHGIHAVAALLRALNPRVLRTPEQVATAVTGALNP